MFALHNNSVRYTRLVHSIYQLFIGGDGNKYVSIRKLQISPDPLTFPGKVNYDVEVEIKQPLNDVNLQLKIVRKTFLLDVTIPCVKQIGSWYVWTETVKYIYSSLITFYLLLYFVFDTVTNWKLTYIIANIMFCPQFNIYHRLLKCFNKWVNRSFVGLLNLLW